MSNIDPSAKIHPSSVVEEGAVIGADCEIGPFCHIGGNVKLGRAVKCYSHVAIAGDTEIGDETRIWPFASLGHQPQDLKYAGEPTQLRIGKRNMIRESVSINLGTAQGGGVTRMGDDNIVMLGAHVAHDCQIGNHCIIVNGVALAGHVVIEDGAVIGGLAAIHQFVRIGKGAMIGGGSMVPADVLPYGLSVGPRAELATLNLVGLRRRGLENAKIREIKKLFEALFDGSAGLRARAEALQSTIEDNPYAQEILDFILNETDRSFLAPAEKTGK